MPTEKLEDRLRNSIIHILARGAGLTLCGMSGFAEKWSSGHSFVRPATWFTATCPACLQVAEAAHHRGKL